MEKYFGSSYRGDPGVPHAKPARFWNIWFGSIAYTAALHFDPHMHRKIFPLHNFHDKAMLFEQYHWKKAMAKKQPYKFKWNEMDKDFRDSYYHNWSFYFP